MNQRRAVLTVLALEIVGCACLVGLFATLRLRQAGAGMPILLTAVSSPTASVVSLPQTASATAPPAVNTEPANGRPTDRPTPNDTANPTPTAVLSTTLTGHVVESGGGLRLRASPGTAGEVLGSLDALATLELVGRTADNRWLEVNTAVQGHGWVNSVYVAADGNLELLQVTGQARDAPSTSFSYLSGVTANAREIFLLGQSVGLRADAFSKVGDSNTDHPAFLTPFDQGGFSLGPYADLELAISFFSGSYARASLAAAGGFNTAKVLDPALAGPGCDDGETPLACEYRVHRPSAALILLGTGDQHTWQEFEARYRRIVEYTMGEGIVPVLITKADELESIENTAPPGLINDTIRRLALEYDVPLLDLRRAVEPLPNRGCLEDGFHYNSPPDGQSANFDAEHMTYGFNMRNLTALEALDALRKYVLY